VSDQTTATIDLRDSIGGLLDAAQQIRHRAETHGAAVACTDPNADPLLVHEDVTRALSAAIGSLRAALISVAPPRPMTDTEREQLAYYGPPPTVEAPSTFIVRWYDDPANAASPEFEVDGLTCAECGDGVGPLLHEDDDYPSRSGVHWTAMAEVIRLADGRVTYLCEDDATVLFAAPGDDADG
jgi:hypothetical protein